MAQVRVEPFENIDTGYRIAFAFTENPYFEEEELTKEVHISELEEGVTVWRVTGCQPTWREEVRGGQLVTGVGLGWVVEFCGPHACSASSQRWGK